jgi:hypothetical protein
MADYNVIINGDCGGIAGGSIELFPTFGVGPYTVDWYNPNLGVDTLVPIGGSSLRTGLVSGLYQIEITDSTTPPNNYLYVNLYVSSGVCLDVSSTVDASCGGNNGSLTITSTSNALPITYYLYGYNQVNTPYFVSSAITDNVQYFPGLSGGTYFVQSVDAGGCSGTTGTCIVKNSSNFNFGLYSIDNSNCSGTQSGAVFITGLTGNPPYTYSWNNGQITQNITGLTNGAYSVTVTDSNGCSVSQSAIVKNAPSLGIINFVNTSPTCFHSDGQVIVNISGGTPPYYYQFSNGANDISYSTSFTYPNLTAGSYVAIITDASLCVVSGATALSTPNSFSSVSVVKQNSTCSSNGGSISASAVGGGTPYIFKLTDSLNNVTTQVGSPSTVFNNLSSGTYHISITNVSSACTYEEVVIIENTQTFEVNTTVSATTCGGSNGSVTVNVSVPGVYTYQLGGQMIANSSLQTVTFNNLAPGFYTVSVTDANPDNLPCTQKKSFVINVSDPLSFVLSKTSCGDGNEGTITALITSGKPPFTLDWSLNVGSQHGIYVTGLTAGTYTLKVTDSDGCTSTKSTTISCSSSQASYSLFNVCEHTFTETSGTKLGLGEMLNDGYQNVTSGETGCSLSSADFVLNVIVGGSGYTTDFYTSTSLLDVPSVDDYITALRSILQTIPGFGSIIINAQSNTIQLNTDCEKALADKNVIIQLQINYNVCCDDI